MLWDNLKWAFMVIAIVFTVWYLDYVHKQRALQVAAGIKSKVYVTGNGPFRNLFFLLPKRVLF